MATLHDMAVNMPLTYITATFDTVTTPDSLVHLFDEYFQYFTHKGHPEPQDAEQVRPILDLINAAALPLAITGDILQGGSENIAVLGGIAALPLIFFTVAIIFDNIPKLLRRVEVATDN